MTDDKWQALKQAEIGTGIGLVAAVFRLVIFGQAGGFLAWLSIASAAILVGIVCSLALAHTTINGVTLSTGVQWATSLVVTFIARDLLTGLRGVGDQFASDPLAIAMRVWNAIRGR
jgi:flagellar biosynthesis protein FliQ